MTDSFTFDDEPASAKGRSTSQTLSRGIQVLEVLAESGGFMTALEIAERLSLSRAVVYRLLRTLAKHNLLSNDAPEGLFGLGLGILSLSRTIKRDVRERAYPILKDLANEIGATAFVGTRDGDEVVCLVSAEPDHVDITVHHREGTRLPMSGASGTAILSTAAETDSDGPRITKARALGFDYRERNRERLASSIAAPIPAIDGGASNACITALYPRRVGAELDSQARLIIDAADRLAQEFLDLN